MAPPVPAGGGLWAAGAAALLKSAGLSPAVPATSLSSSEFVLLKLRVVVVELHGLGPLNSILVSS